MFRFRTGGFCLVVACFVTAGSLAFGEPIDHDFVMSGYNDEVYGGGPNGGLVTYLHNNSVDGKLAEWSDALFQLHEFGANNKVGNFTWVDKGAADGGTLNRLDFGETIKQSTGSVDPDDDKLILDLTGIHSADGWSATLTIAKLDLTIGTADDAGLRHNTLDGSFDWVFEATHDTELTFTSSGTAGMGDTDMGRFDHVYVTDIDGSLLLEIDEWTGLTNLFAGAVPSSWDLSNPYDPDTTSGGIDLGLYALFSGSNAELVIPEPSSTVALVGLALTLGIGGWRRRKSRQVA